MPGGRRRCVAEFVAVLAIAANVPQAGAQASPVRQRSAARRSDAEQLDCTGCHRLAHGVEADSGLRASATCAACHVRTHAATVALFTGRGADTVLHADRMFLARVECRSCHVGPATPAADGRPSGAVGDACVSCHGTRFGFMLPLWSSAMRGNGAAAAAYVAAAGADARLSGTPGARALLQDARADIALVEDGNGLHNVPGADALLRSAIRKAEAAYRAAGLPEVVPPSFDADPSTGSCGYCHYGVGAVRDSVFGQSFSHAPHVRQAALACVRCHSSAGYFATSGGRLDPAHGKTTVSAAECGACHHVIVASPCTTCHRRQELTSRSKTVVLPLHLQPPTAPRSRRVVFQHGVHRTVACTSCHTSRDVIASFAACATCHESHHRSAAECMTCHGTNLLPEHTAAQHFTCAQCHARATLGMLTGDRTFCLSCHVDRRGHQPSRECSTCHLQMSPAEVRARILGRAP